MADIYIQGLGNISPQQTFYNNDFLTDISEYQDNVLTVVAPDFKKYIPVPQLRRMSRMFKIGLSAAKICATDAALDMPDAIITASGYGCIGDTSKFLLEIIENKEKQLTPTFFMQSTYNSISGGIAMSMKCNNYNTTYVHRGFAFETALQDAMLQIQDQPAKRILLGGFDETNDGQFIISMRTGHHRKEKVSNLSLFGTKGRGTLQGEGASFFTLSGQNSGKTYARLAGIKMVYAPHSASELMEALKELLNDGSTGLEDIDIVINGIGGDTKLDEINNEMMSILFENTQQVVFKHLSGDYCTASSFGMWLGVKILNHQMVPEVVKVNHIAPKRPIKNVVQVNHYRGKNYGLLWLKSAD